MNNFLFFLLPAAGSMLLVYGIYQVWYESRKGERRKVLDRLQGSSGKIKSSQVQSILRRDLTDTGHSMLGGALGKLSFIPKLQVTLEQANVNMSAAKLLANLSIGSIVVLVGLLVLQLNIFVALGCAVAVFATPLMVIMFKRRLRMNKLTDQLPDVFEMMSQALRAGHSLASAIQLIHEQMPDPISTEFGLVFHEQNLGIKIEDALLSMANRVDSLDVRFFVTAVLVQRQTGGDLAEVLDKISSIIRQRIELFGMVRGLTAEGRLSGWVLFGLPFLVFGAVLYINPSYADVLLTDPTGKIMLMVAAGMQLMGLAMIRYIVNIKV
jgi:tight adherence protein B